MARMIYNPDTVETLLICLLDVGIMQTERSEVIFSCTFICHRGIPRPPWLRPNTGSAVMLHLL